MIYAQVGWPEELNRKIVVRDFAEVILMAENGDLHDTIKSTIAGYCESRKDGQTGKELIQNLDYLSAQIKATDNISMYPNDVFGQRNNNGQN